MAAGGTGRGGAARDTRAGRLASALAGVVLAASGLAGCATARAPVDTPPALAWLSFLDEPGLLRADVDQRLGAPRAVYEQGRVASYRLRVHRPWYDLRDSFDDLYALMVEYDEAGHVRRHALVAQPDTIDAPVKR